MPQLETSTFFSQFFWTILCLFTLYFYIHKYILPEITRLSKLRSKLTTRSNAFALDTKDDSLWSLEQINASRAMYAKNDQFLAVREVTSPSLLDSNPARQKQTCDLLVYYAMEKCVSALKHIRAVERVFLLQVAACKFIKGNKGKKRKVKRNRKVYSTVRSSRKRKNAAKETSKGKDLRTSPLSSSKGSKMWKKRYNEIFARQEWHPLLAKRVKKIANQTYIKPTLARNKKPKIGKSRKLLRKQNSILARKRSNIVKSRNLLRKQSSILLQRNYNNAQLAFICKMPFS